MSSRRTTDGDGAHNCGRTSPPPPAAASRTRRPAASMNATADRSIARTVGDSAKRPASRPAVAASSSPATWITPSPASTTERQPGTDIDRRWRGHRIERAIASTQSPLEAWRHTRTGEYGAAMADRRSRAGNVSESYPLAPWAPSCRRVDDDVVLTGLAHMFDAALGHPYRSWTVASASSATSGRVHRTRWPRLSRPASLPV
jgi:hypothetical protein